MPNIGSNLLIWTGYVPGKGMVQTEREPDDSHRFYQRIFKDQEKWDQIVDFWNNDWNNQQDKSIKAKLKRLENIINCRITFIPSKLEYRVENRELYKSLCLITEHGTDAIVFEHFKLASNPIMAKKDASSVSIAFFIKQFIVQK